MRTYERPTLIKAGSFKKVTGLGGSGPRDFAFRHQMLWKRLADQPPSSGPGWPRSDHRPVGPGLGLQLVGPTLVCVFLCGRTGS